MLVYLAHPVGHEPDRTKNLENTKKWIKFFLDHTDWSLSVPWYAYVASVDESYRKRAMRDDLVNLDKCDAIVLTGGRITDGMRTELGVAIMAGQKVFDLTSAGYSPDDNPELSLELLKSVEACSKY